MPDKEQTKLEVFGFSEKPEDMFYCLLDLTNQSAGIDLTKLSSANPQKLDEALEKMGCLVIFSQNDIDDMLNGSDADQDELHEILYQWAKDQGIV
ncbi:MAG: hypothetical protein WEB89_05070 [Balneolales bacterium]